MGMGAIGMGLVGLVCIGMGVVATRLPKLYRHRLFKPLYAIAFLVLCFASAWGMAAAEILEGLMPLLTPEQYAAVRELVGDQRDAGLFVQLGCAAFFAYTLWLDRHASAVLRRRRRRRSRTSHSRQRTNTSGGGRITTWGIPPTDP